MNKEKIYDLFLCDAKCDMNILNGYINTYCFKNNGILYNKESCKEFFTKLFEIKSLKSFVKDYCEFVNADISKYNKNKVECFAKMTGAFIGSIYICTIYRLGNYRVKESLSYCLLYVLTDEYMDDKDNSKEDKKIFINNILDLFNNLDKIKNLKDGESHISRIAYHLNVILENNIETFNFLRESFLTNIESMNQNKIKLMMDNLELLFDITWNKSVSTAYCGYHILTGKVIEDKDINIFVFLSQLVSDVADIDKDINDNIYTLPIHYYSKYGNVDRIIYIIAKILIFLSERYYFLKMYMFTYICSDTNFYKYISSELSLIMSNYSLMFLSSLEYDNDLTSYIKELTAI